MKKPNSYKYPVIITQNEDQTVTAEIPDFDRSLHGKDMVDIYQQVEKTLAWILIGIEKKGETPQPPAYRRIELEQNQNFVMMNVSMPKYRASIGAQEPAGHMQVVDMKCWLHDAACENALDLTDVLERGILSRLPAAFLANNPYMDDADRLDVYQYPIIFKLVKKKDKKHKIYRAYSPDFRIRVEESGRQNAIAAMEDALCEAARAAVQRGTLPVPTPEEALWIDEKCSELMVFCPGRAVLDAAGREKRDFEKVPKDINLLEQKGKRIIYIE